MTPHASFIRFIKNNSGATSVVIALSLIPLGLGTGVAFDVARATNTAARLQTAIDAAVLSSVALPDAQRFAYARNVYAAQFQTFSDVTGTPQFVNNSDGSLTGTITGTMPTTMMRIAGKNSMLISVGSRASRPVEDTSCILTLAGGLTIGTTSLTLNGIPQMDLTGCSLRSNSSTVCNGHDGEAVATISVGTTDSRCNNPVSSATPIPDIHAGLASNIDKRCGVTTGSFIWTIGTLPSSPHLLGPYTNTQGIHEYHLCGNVTVKGSGTLLGSTGADSILYVENGAFILDKNTDATLLRTTLVLTGNNTSTNHFIDFPQASGQGATLRMTPSQSPANPWQGVAIYQDPSLTTNINASWGPGTTLIADGLMYFSKASMTMSGNGASNGAGCTKFVTRDVTISGNVDWKQSPAGCASIGLKQYKSAPRILS